MKWRLAAVSLVGAVVLLMLVMPGQARLAAAQEQTPRFQRIIGQLRAGETHAYVLENLQPGDRLAVAMRTTTGNLDPAVGIAVTFVVNVLVLLYNVRMKQLENLGRAAQVERIDNVLDWVYPLMYVASIGVVVLLFF